MKNKTLKTIALILFLLGFAICPFICHAQTPCAIKGDNKNPKFEHLDSLKNRNYKGTIDTTVTLQSILATGNDENRFKPSQYVRLVGYVILVKAGDAETCNCHAFGDMEHKDTLSREEQKKVMDIHIELALNPTDKPTQAMIVEINRFTKADSLNYTVANLKKLVGKKVEVDGFLYFDVEHKQNSVNCNPYGTNLWRRTCTEVHPCIFIKQLF